MLHRGVDTGEAVLCTCDGDAPLRAVGGVQGEVARAGGEEELEVGERGQGLLGEGSAFALSDDNLEWVQALDELLVLGGVARVQSVGEVADVDAGGQVGKVPGGDVLVVVENGDFGRHLDGVSM